MTEVLWTRWQSSLKPRGDPDAVYNTDKLKISDTITEVCADSDGYIQSIQSELIGKSSMILGGGKDSQGRCD